MKIISSFLILIFLGCDMNESKFDSKFEVPKLDVDSNYSGKQGLLAFFDCIGRHPLQINSYEFQIDPLGDGYWPASYLDLLSVGGFSIQGFQFLDSKNVSTFKAAFPDDYKYLKYASSFINDQHRSAKFVNEYYDYTASQDVASVALVPSDWYDSLIYIGGNSAYGVRILLNPKVKTQDNEWEVWLYDPRFPGAYRFLSVAEVVSHLNYHYDFMKGGNEFRYGQREVADSCSRILFNSNSKL